jgi:hypothetical protein
VFEFAVAAQEGMDLQVQHDKVQGGLNGFRWQHTFGSIAYVTVHHCRQPPGAHRAAGRVRVRLDLKLHTLAVGTALEHQIKKAPGSGRGLQFGR